MKKIKYIFCLIIAVVCLITSLSACNIQPSVIEEEIYALNTIITFTVYSGNTEAVNQAKAEINRLEALFSVTNIQSDVSRINSSPDTFVKVSEDTFNLIKTALQLSESSKGVFDITVYPAVKLWGFTTSEYKVPTESEITDIKQYVGYNKVQLDENTLSVKVPKDTELDLGGIAKGYIADKAAEVLINEGVTSALLNFGGNIRLIGSKHDGSDFKIGIKAPFDSGYFAVLKTQNKTVSTSGGYERYFEENGKQYHHILNPFTATPAESDIISATIVGEKGEVCDAWSTAVFINGSSKISELAKFYPDYSFIALTDKAVYISESLSDKFELTEKYKNIEIKVI